MNIIDKTLYHQIHPFKLTTDVIATFAAVYLLWVHLIIEGLIVAFVPSLIISLFMLRLMDFEKQKQSRLGKYLKKYMGRGADTVRSVGFVAMLVGGGFHFPWLIALGFLSVLLSWLNGLIFTRQAPGQVTPRKSGK
ncbi:MAG TPA: hypothetical protein VLX91_06880 [Candidatus Acidoferrales bacterium]|nr:hypothetical protein [Candidatus Acidoferrales bacterium]